MKLQFEQPTASADFTADSVPISVLATSSQSDPVSKVDLYYDTTLVSEMAASGTTSVYSVNNWDPNVDGNGLPMPFGQHALKAVATTKSGLQGSTYLPFTKPLLFRGWRQDVIQNGSSVPLPPAGAAMEINRNHLHAYGRTDRVFAIFGDTDGPLPAASIESLNTMVNNPTWSYRSLGNLIWRDFPAVVGTGDLIYVIGGSVPSGAGTTLTPSVSYYNPFSQTSTEAPPLGLPAVPVADAAAATYKNAIYLVGGTTNGNPSGATGKMYRLDLNADGTPKATSWVPLASLPSGIRRYGAPLVALNGQLYLLGGDDENGQPSEYIFRYDPNSDSWTQSGFLPQVVSHEGAAVMGGEIWLFGGYTTGFPSITNQVVRFDPTNNQAVTFPIDTDLPVPLADMGVATVDGQVYVVGGSTLDSSGNEVPSNAIYRVDSL